MGEIQDKVIKRIAVLAQLAPRRLERSQDRSQFIARLHNALNRLDVEFDPNQTLTVGNSVFVYTKEPYEFLVRRALSLMKVRRLKAMKGLGEYNLVISGVRT